MPHNNQGTGTTILHLDYLSNELQIIRLGKRHAKLSGSLFEDSVQNRHNIISIIMKKRFSTTRKTNKRKVSSRRITRTHDRVVIFVLICGILIVFISLLCYPIGEININVVIFFAYILSFTQRTFKDEK